MVGRSLYQHPAQIHVTGSGALISPLLPVYEQRRASLK